jgi:hypothetical protein
MGFMDWQVKPITRTCAVSGRELVPGDLVTCIVHKPTGAAMDRTDVLREHAHEFQTTGLLLGKWNREVKERGEEERAQRAQLLASREEFFLSLFDDPSDPTGEKAILKHILAFLLERRRLIKSAGPTAEGVTPYLHVRTQQIFSIPALDLRPEDIQKVSSTLDLLIA